VRFSPTMPCEKGYLKMTILNPILDAC